MNTVEVRRSEDRENFVLSFSYDEKIVSIVKTIPKRKYDPEKREWSIPFMEFELTVSKSNISRIKNPLDDIMEGKPI